MNQQKIDKIRKEAIDTLKSHKTLVPVMMLEKRENKGIEVIGLKYENELSKMLIHKTIGDKLKTGEYKSFIHLSEAWLIMREKDQELEKPSEAAE